MTTRIGRAALSGICAGIALYVAVRSDNESVQAAAALTSSCLLGFTVTSLVIERHQQIKSRETNTDAYVELLRQVRTQQPPLPRQPVACQGCQHYHGRIYGGTLLVCAMHPFGVEDDRCPDWETPHPPEAPDSDLDL